METRPAAPATTVAGGVTVLSTRPPRSRSCFALRCVLPPVLGALALFAAAPAGAQRVIPTVPQNVQVTAGSASLTLTWQAPSSWGSFAAAGYEIDWCACASAPAHTSNDWQIHIPDPASSATSYTFTGSYRTNDNQSHTVANGTTYQFRIRAFTRDAANLKLVSFYVTASGTAQPSSNANLSGLTASSATSATSTFTPLTLTPSTFSADTTSYTATVANARTHAKLRPTAAHSGATVTVGGTTVNSGAESGAIELNVGDNAITVRVTAENEATKDYTVTIRRRSANANLSGLTASSATSAGGAYSALTLAPVFAAGTTSYTATVANARTHAKLTPTVADTGKATVTVSGAAVDSGTASDPIGLSLGPNAITVRVTAEDGNTKDYTVTITRPSANADLSGLTASSARSSGGAYSALTLSPAFSAGTTGYTAAVANDRTHAKLRPTAAHSAATITVGGTPVNSGAESGAIALSPGSNAITVRVTAQDTTTKDYTVTITRRAPGAPTGLGVSAGDAELTASWTAPADVNVARYEAQIRLSTASWPGSDTDVTGTSHTFPNLVNGSPYQIRVRTVAVGQATPSAWTAPVEGTPRAVVVPAVSLSVSPNPVTEGSSVTITARLSSALSSPVTIPLTLTDNTAEPEDHGPLASITISAGATTGTGVITTAQDTDTADERFTVALGSNLPSSVRAGNPSSVQVRIRDDDGGGVNRRGGGGGASTSAPPPELVPRDARAREDAGRLVFPVELSGAASGPVRVRWRTLDDTATAGRDYAGASGVLTIPAGERSGRIIVRVLDDWLDEPDEALWVRFNAPEGATLADTTALGTILDDDAAPALLVGDAAALEGEGALGFFVWLASDSARTVSAEYRTGDGTATAGNDYVGVSGTVTIPPGSGGATVWVQIVDDRLHENLETLALVLENPRFAVAGDLRATGTIRDDDAAPSLRVPDVTASERAGRLEFVATLGAVAGRTVSWRFETADGRAVAEEDYRWRAGTVVFRPGTVRAAIPVAIVDDLLDEAEEDFRLTLRNLDTPATAPVVATGTIVDDDDNAIVADAWLSRFGRSVATQVVDAVGGRLARPNGAGSHFLLGGLGPGSAAGAGGRLDAFGRTAGWTGPGFAGSPGTAWGLDAARVLAGTSFAYQRAPDGSSGRGLEGRWTAWGRGSLLEFEGLDPGVGVTGDVLNVTAGFDVEVGPVLVGLGLAGSQGRGRFHVARSDVQSERLGETRSLLGSVHPYGQLSLGDRLRVWGLGGLGAGQVRISGSPEIADLRLRMWAAGGRGELPVPFLERAGLALKSDFFWVETESDPTESRRGTRVEAQRLRLLVESTFRVFSFWGGEFAPLLEAGFRSDEGDAETGRGLEVGGGFRYRNPRYGLAVEATGRTLVSHEAARYREWGFGGGLRLDPGPDYRGLSLAVRSSAGAAGSGVERLWSGPVAGLGGGSLAGRHEAEVGYGFEAFGGGAVLVPYGSFGYSLAGAQSVRVGSRLHVGSRWALSLEADRSHTGLLDPWYRLVLAGHLLPPLPAPIAERR